MQKLQIDYFLAGFCVLLRIICVLLCVFLRRFCLRFGAFGDQNTTFLPYDRKNTVCFCHWGQVGGTMPEWWGGWAGTISYNRFCLCICLKKLQNMLSVANSWNRICWSDTQRSSTGKLDYSCLNDDQKFLPHAISKRLIQNVPIWHVYKICALFLKICVHSSNWIVFLLRLKAQVCLKNAIFRARKGYPPWSATKSNNKPRRAQAIIISFRCLRRFLNVEFEFRSQANSLLFQQKNL